MTSRPEWWVGRLDLAPRVAELLGQYFGEIAVMELHVIRLFSLAIGELSGPETPIASATFAPLQLSKRIDITLAVTAKSALPERDKVDISAFIERARSINSRRNTYAHGLFEANELTGEVRLTPFFSAPRQRRAEMLTVEKVRQDIDAIRKLSSEILDRFFSEQVVSV